MCVLNEFLILLETISYTKMWDWYFQTNQIWNMIIVNIANKTGSILSHNISFYFILFFF